MGKYNVRWKSLIIFLVVVLMLCVALAGCVGSPDDGDDGDGGGQGDGTVINLASEDVDIGLAHLSLSYNHGAELKQNLNIYYQRSLVTRVYHDEEHEDLTVAYQDNVNVGVATITVSAKSGSTQFVGSKSTTFEITKGYALANSVDSLISQLSNPNYETVSVCNNFSIPQGITMTIAEGVTLDLSNFDLTNNGTIINNGTIDWAQWNIFSNNGIFKNNGVLKFSTNGAKMYNAGSIENNNTIDFASNYNAYIYTNSAIGGTVSSTNISSHVKYRVNLADCQVNLDAAEMVYTGQERNMDVVSITKDGQTLSMGGFSKTYSNNVNAGTATLSLEAGEFSNYYYGKTSVNYTILKIKNVRVKTIDAFYNTIDNPNYEQITIEDVSMFDDLCDYQYDFTVAEGKTLVLNEDYLYLRGKITVNGKLVIKEYRGGASYGYYNNNPLTPLNLVIAEGGIVEVAAGKKVSIGNLSGEGKLVNNGYILLNNKYTYWAFAGVTIDNYGNIYEQEIRDIKEGFNIVTKSGAATYVNADTVQAEGAFVTAEAGSTYVVRALLNLEDLYATQGADKVALDGYSTPYIQGSIQKADVWVKDLAGTGYLDQPQADNRPVEYEYDVTYQHANGTDGDSPTNAGLVDVVVTTKPFSTSYYGWVSAQYAISKISITITGDSMSLADAMLTGNYNEYVLTVDSDANGTLLEGDRLVISSGVTLKSSSLRGSGTIVNNGVLINKTTDEMTLDSIVVDTMLNQFVGTFTNNGTVYVNGEQSAVTSGYYLRTHVKNVDEPTRIGDGSYVFNAVYDAEDQLITRYEPAVVLVSNAQTLIQGQDYTLTYADNNMASSLTVKAVAKIDSIATSQYVYGYRKIKFHIEPGVAEVSTVEQLRSVLELKKPLNNTAYSYNYTRADNIYDSSKEYGCFVTVKLMQSLKAEFRTSTTENNTLILTVLKNTTFDLNGYELCFNQYIPSSSSYGARGCKIYNQGVILTTDAWKDATGIDDGKRGWIVRDSYSYVPTKVEGTNLGMIIGTVTTTEGLGVLSAYCDYIDVEADLEGCIISTSTYNDLVVDLHGHNLAMEGIEKLEIDIFNDVTIKSTGSMATIGELYVGTRNAAHKVTLDNIKIDYLNFGSGTISEVKSHILLTGGSYIVKERT